MGTVDSGFQEGVTKGREDATEGEEESTWEDEGGGGVKPGRGWE